MADKDVNKEQEKIEEPDLKTPPEGYNQKEWLALSEEERKGLLAPEKVEEIEEVKPPEKTDTKTTEDNQPPPAFTPVYQFEPTGPTPEEVQAKEAEVKEALSALNQKLEDGEIAIKDYTDERDRLRDELRDLKDDLKAATRQAEIEKSRNEQSAQQKWEWEQQVFFEQNPDYAHEKDPIMYGALDSAIKTLATKEENTKKSGFWFLTEAKKMVDERFNRNVNPNQPPPPSDGKPPRPQLPKTLSGIPPAEGNSIQQDELSHLDGLEGLELEKAVAKLTPEQQQKFMETC